MKLNKKGFTLIELMFVLVITSMLYQTLSSSTTTFSKVLFNQAYHQKVHTDIRKIESNLNTMYRYNMNAPDYLLLEAEVIELLDTLNAEHPFSGYYAVLFNYETKQGVIYSVMTDECIDKYHELGIAKYMPYIRTNDYLEFYELYELIYYNEYNIISTFTEQGIRLNFASEYLRDDKREDFKVIGGEEESEE